MWSCGCWSCSCDLWAGGVGSGAPWDWSEERSEEGVSGGEAVHHWSSSSRSLCASPCAPPRASPCASPCVVVATLCTSLPPSPLPPSPLPLSSPPPSLRPPSLLENERVRLICTNGSEGFLTRGGAVGGTPGWVPLGGGRRA
eukprot:scaffold119284_cov53-Phaeocystis_antarctica.AAC.1